jgi:hypothetical protein
MPYEVLFGKAPSYDDMKVFGCLTYFRNTETRGDKFAPRGKAGVFLGYPLGTKGYKVYDLEKRRIIITRDTKFIEEVFPFAVTKKDTKQQIYMSHEDNEEQVAHQEKNEPILTTPDTFPPVDTSQSPIPLGQKQNNRPNKIRTLIKTTF